MNNIENLVKILSNLSEEEVNTLLKSIPKKDKTEKSSTSSKIKKPIKSKKTPYENFLDLDIPENPIIVADSKKLNENKKKKKQISERPKVEMIKVRCKNCQKEFEVPSYYPGLKNFVCCTK